MQARRRCQRKEHNYHLVHMPHSGLRGDYYQTGGDYIIWQKMLFYCNSVISPDKTTACALPRHICSNYFVSLNQTITKIRQVNYP